MKEIKVEWCENFIKHLFEKLNTYDCTGIKAECFWRQAEQAGLYQPGEYGGSMSNALRNLCKVEAVFSDQDEFLYHVFRLK